MIYDSLGYQSHISFILKSFINDDIDLLAMYGIDYILASPYNIVVVIVALIVMIVGSVTDFQKREVADWVNYGLFFAAIGLRLLYSAVTLNPMVLVDGFMGFLFFTLLGMLMFYSGQWGGGDTKMIIGLGTLFGLSLFPFNIYNVSNSLIIAFIVNSIFLGSFYGFAWSAVLTFNNMEKFLVQWKRASSQLLIFKIMVLLFAFFLVILSMFMINFRLMLIPLAVISILMLYTYIYTQTIEKTCMVKMLPPSKVTEGDWINKEVKVKGKYICGPKDLGISKKQIALLKKLRVKKIPVKIGIPFVPSFLLGFIAVMLVGNIITLMLNYILPFA